MIYRKRKQKIVQFECCEGCISKSCLGTRPITTSSNSKLYGRTRLPCYKGE